jgi:hypothetical protein
MNDLHTKQWAGRRAQRARVGGWVRTVTVVYLCTARRARLGMDEHTNVLYIFRHSNPLFRHNRFCTLFFSMKVAESGNIV